MKKQLGISCAVFAISIFTSNSFAQAVKKKNTPAKPLKAPSDN